MKILFYHLVKIFINFVFGRELMNFLCPPFRSFKGKITILLEENIKNLVFK